MLKNIAKVAKRLNTISNGYAAELKLAHLDTLIITSSSPSDRVSAQMRKGIALLEYGDENGAVKLMEQVLGDVGHNSPEARRYTLYCLGTAYLRLAERINCVGGHAAESCIMPLRGSGIHDDKYPAQKAIRTLETLLTESPNDLYFYDALWMLNIAYMTIGQYPKGVPKKWLIPNLNAPDHRVRPFVDVAGQMKIKVNDRSGGCILEDFDNDGLLDIVTSAWDIGEDPMHFFKNNGDGTFSDFSEKSGLADFRGGLNIQQTDYNNDGFMDIYVLRGGWQGGGAGTFGEQPNSLLRNNGNGTFTDVTIEAGLLKYAPSQTATWNDFNNDGWLDLFVGNESIPGGKVYACELYLNNGDGTFKNVASESGANKIMFVKGVVSGDFDNDGWADIFISSMDAGRVLLRNKGLKDGKLSFEDVSQQAGFAQEKYRSFPTFFFDYDNDGWLDLFVCNYYFDGSLANYAAKDALKLSNEASGRTLIYKNNQNGTFTDVSGALGMNKLAFAMSANFGDFDNDGFLDMYLGTGNPYYQSLLPNKLFMNLGGKKFADATNSSRTGNLQKGHGVAIADVDNDGDQDIFIEMGGAYRGDVFPNAMYMNPGQNQNNWLYLKLEGTKSNRAAIGAKITVKFKENGQERMLYREVNSGGSFGSSPLRRELGIGQATAIDEISITWPASGIKQVLKDIRPNQLIKVTEGKDGFEKLPLKKFDIRNADGSIPMCAPLESASSWYSSPVSEY
jgi:hypothetical protein